MPNWNLKALNKSTWGSTVRDQLDWSSKASCLSLLCLSGIPVIRDDVKPRQARLCYKKSKFTLMGLSKSVKDCSLKLFPSIMWTLQDYCHNRGLCLWYISEGASPFLLRPSWDTNCSVKKPIRVLFLPWGSRMHLVPLWSYSLPIYFLLLHLLPFLFPVIFCMSWGCLSSSSFPSLRADFWIDEVSWLQYSKVLVGHLLNHLLCHNKPEHLQLGFGVSSDTV